MGLEKENTPFQTLFTHLKILYFFKELSFGYYYFSVTIRKKNYYIWIENEYMGTWMT